jgi:hypothetical protein
MPVLKLGARTVLYEVAACEDWLVANGKIPFARA